VPLYYDQMTEPDRHFCYVATQPGIFTLIRSAFSPSHSDREVA
jgi:hypothetical protein